jgi:hypothetical protein
MPAGPSAVKPKSEARAKPGVRRLPGWRVGLDSSLPRGAWQRGTLPKEKAHPRSSRQAAGGCGATGRPRCHGWQRGPTTQPFVVQGLAGPRKARCHVATYFKAGNEGQTDQDRQRQSNTLAQADSVSAARARMGRTTSFPRSAWERGTYPGKRRTPGRHQPAGDAPVGLRYAAPSAACLELADKTPAGGADILVCLGLMADKNVCLGLTADKNVCPTSQELALGVLRARLTS